jgi:hypothetical protein
MVMTKEFMKMLTLSLTSVLLLIAAATLSASGM